MWNFVWKLQVEIILWTAACYSITWIVADGEHEDYSDSDRDRSGASEDEDLTVRQDPQRQAQILSDG